MIAARQGHDSTVTQLLSANSNINLQASLVGKGGWSALIVAAYNGHDSIVAQLLSAKADVNLVDNEGRSALMRAARRGHDSTVTQLLSAKADVNLVDQEGCSAWDLSNDRGKSEWDLPSGKCRELIGAHIESEMRTIHDRFRQHLELILRPSPRQMQFRSAFRVPQVRWAI